MNCPVCKNQKLVPGQLEQNLTARKCEGCGGHWINSFEFWRWIQEGKASNTRPTGRPVPLPESEPKGAKICPECGHILGRFPAGHSLGFKLDRCGHCGGIWFDRNEWEALRERELLPQVHLIFSQAWQARVRREETAEHLDELFRQRVGEADYAEAKRVKAWLRQHPHREKLLAFLENEE